MTYGFQCCSDLCFVLLSFCFFFFFNVDLFFPQVFVSKGFGFVCSNLILFFFFVCVGKVLSSIVIFRVTVSLLYCTVVLLFFLTDSQLLVIILRK